MSMGRRRDDARVVQAWIELVSDDPEAVSALAVARAHLTAGQALRSLRRMRLLELRGRLPERPALEALLHRSTQFYNPHKERCAIRITETDRSPLGADERAVLVFERDGARRGAAERWWLHETGEPVEVREGVAWALVFDRSGAAEVEDLALVRGRRHGLLCNPHSQECRVAGERVPLPWLNGDDAPRPAPGRRPRKNPTRSKR